MATNYLDRLEGGTVFLPEPCQACDNGQTCETHAPVSWADSWLHPSERKFAPKERNERQ